MTLSNQAKWEITEMDTERLKKFYDLCRQLSYRKEPEIKQYYNVMLQAVHDELYARKVIIDY